LIFLVASQREKSEAQINNELLVQFMESWKLKLESQFYELSWLKKLNSSSKQLVFDFQKKKKLAAALEKSSKAAA